MSNTVTPLVPLPIRITASQLKRLQAMSKKTDVPIQRLIRRAIEEFLEREKTPAVHRATPTSDDPESPAPRRRAQQVAFR